MNPVAVLLSYAVTRLQEPSTWLGLIAAGFGYLHLAVTPDLAQTLAAAGVGLAGVAAVFLKDGGSAWHKVPPAPAAAPAVPAPSAPTGVPVSVAGAAS